MSRIRTIKPEFFTDPKVARMPAEVQLLYIGLWTFCDDEGTCPADPYLVKSAIMPFSPIPVGEFLPGIFQEFSGNPPGNVQTVSGMLAGLVQTGRLVPYEVNGEWYFWLPKFREHQQVRLDKQTKRFPKPERWVAGEKYQSGYLVQDASRKLPGSVLPGNGNGNGSGNGSKQQPPPTPSVAGEGAAAAAASSLSDFYPHEPTSGAKVDEPDPTPVTPTPVTPASMSTPTPLPPPAPPEPTPEPAVRPSRRPRPAAPAQPDAAAADLTAAATVVRLWNTGPAQAGCPACAPAAELAPETRDRLAELLRRHGENGLRDAFDRVGRSSFLVRRAKIPTTLPRVANGLWEGLLSGAYDDGRAGPAAGRKRKGLFPELEALHFPDDETREYALNPMNGLSIESIRRLAGPQPQEATP